MNQHDLYRSVVKIRYRDSPSNTEFLGSGVLISPKGLVLTNNHVVENESFGTSFGDVSVHVVEDVAKPPTNTYAAELVVRNDMYDLALLWTKGLTADCFVSILTSPHPDAGYLEKPVRVIGFPDLGGDCLTVTRGIVSGFDREGNLKTDAEINHGNSGGGAFDDRGQFLGIPTFVMPGDAGKIGYIVPVNRICEWLSRTLKNGLPASDADLDPYLTRENIDFGDNQDEDTRYPRIVAKFAAIEMLLKEGVFENIFPQVGYILERRPSSPLAYHYLGDAHLYRGEYDDAALAYRRALALNPYDVPARGNYALTLIHLKRPEAALAEYETVITIADNAEQRALALHNMGRIYDQMAEPEQAKRYYQKALDIKPDFDLVRTALKSPETGQKA